jgi:hypothetical protein
MTDTAKWPSDRIIDLVADWLFLSMFGETTVFSSENKTNPMNILLGRNVVVANVKAMSMHNHRFRIKGY